MLQESPRLILLRRETLRITETKRGVRIIVTCARCGKEIKAGTRVWTLHFGQFIGKQICEDCNTQIKTEPDKLVQEQQQGIAQRPGPIIDDDAQLKGLVADALNNYDRSLKGSKLATIGLALTDDRAMWNVTLLKGIGELLKASLYYDELLLRKLNAIQEQLAGTQIKEKLPETPAKIQDLF